MALSPSSMSPSVACSSRPSLQRCRKSCTLLSAGVWQHISGMPSNRAASIACSELTGWMTPADLGPALVHQGVGDAQGYPDAMQHVGLYAHDLLEVGQPPTLGMMRQDQVDGLTTFAQSVGQQHLAHPDVDAHQDVPHLGLRVADQDATVDERVGQASRCRTPTGGNRGARRVPFAPRRAPAGPRQDPAGRSACPCAPRRRTRQPASCAPLPSKTGLPRRGPRERKRLAGEM